jgi:predicted transcriptional regulator
MREAEKFSERRNKIEIMIAILEVCRTGALKTEIVYRANLNFKRVKPYITFLEKRNLIVSSSPTWTTTEKGRTFIDGYYNVLNLLAEG